MLILLYCIEKPKATAFRHFFVFRQSAQGHKTREKIFCLKHKKE